MDSRAALVLGGSLLMAAAGCQHQVLNVANPPPSSSAAKAMPAPDPSQIKKASGKAKELPPLVLVSYGNFEAGEAFSDRTDQDRRQVLCDSARADYEKALKLDSKCVPAYQGLARLYTAMHQHPLAVETYHKALKLAPNDAALWYELGLCHNSQKNWGPALECLEKATRIDPANRSYANAMGVVLAASGRYEDSLKCFVRSSGEALGNYRLAQTLRHLQQTELSRRYLEAAVQKDPSLADLAMRNGDMLASNAPTIQQTAYQTPAHPETNFLPVQTAAPSNPLPVQTVAPSNYLPSRTAAPAAADQPSSSPVILPPPPPINGD